MKENTRLDLHFYHLHSVEGFSLESKWQQIPSGFLDFSIFYQILIVLLSWWFKFFLWFPNPSLSFPDFWVPCQGNQQQLVSRPCFSAFSPLLQYPSFRLSFCFSFIFTAWSAEKAKFSQNTPTPPLQRGKTPPVSVLHMTLSNLKLGNAEYPFIAIAPRSTLARNSSTW